LVPATAHAGRNFYGWLNDTDVMPERGVEMQNWIEEENHNDVDGGTSTTTWGVAPFIGITDQLELALPVEVVWFGKTGGAAGTSFTNFGAQLRYRLVTNDPEEKPPFAPLVHVDVRRLTYNRDAVEGKVGFSGSFESGIVHALVDVAFVTEIDDESEYGVNPGAGVSIEVADDIRVGAEVFGHVSFNDPEMPGAPKNWLIAGPNASWTHGRFWLSGAFAFGLQNIGTAPRVTWGIAF
jgi:hypothetical protein